ncbi:major Facilitator Superfamily protein [Collimonas arenae]|uniref:Major Facilitator Superfamily protein n=1 Tax=Collimonas arenae TaxID=279058 RepID=A0A127QGT5_9BURK|nr:MFS transporter [Collimonas arenae]AMO99385.1 major Facilitator Superfamily protein [Collimonas arenae]AMP09287.1 major Facilitator Superfamily protein [Collimonas arenae]
MIEKFKRDLAQLGKPFFFVLVSEMATLSALLLGNMTISWWIAQRGGAADLATFGVVVAAASLVAIPLLSPFGDRYPKKLLMAIGFIAIAAESVVLALLAQAHYYHLTTIIACEMIGVCAMAIIMPCVQTIAAELVAADKVSLAMSMQKVSGSIGGILGPALGGGVIAASGIASALWLHVALLLVAAFAATRLPKAVSVSNRASLGLGQWMRELGAGLRIKWHVPLERNWTLVNLVVGMFYAPAIGMMAALRITNLGLSATWLGATNMGIMSGMFLGFLGCASFASRKLGRFRALMSAAALRVLALLAVGLTATPAAMVAAFFMLGISQSTTQFVGVTHRLLAMPAEYRARNASVNILAWQISSTLGPAIAGVALLGASVAQCYIAFGILIAVCTMGLSLVPRIHLFLGLDHDAVTGWYRKEYPEAFPSKTTSDA